MPIPSYDKIMYPILELASHGVHTLKVATDAMADYFNLSSEERAQLKPSGKGLLIKNRTGWAICYLVKAGLLSRPKRGYFTITDIGINYLKVNKQLTLKDLKQYPDYIEFKYGKKKDELKKTTTKQVEEDPATPDEMIETASEQISAEVRVELIDKILNSSPEFLEIIVIQLLEKMGYGGEGDDATQHLGGSGDGGVDGVIKQDKLGLDLIYVQAKRYAPDNVVGRPAIQNFSGSLTGFNCQKGVFISTSMFSKQAIEYVKGIPQKIILVDGAKLASLMYEYNLGVRPIQTIDIKKIDDDYFPED